MLCSKAAVQNKSKSLKKVGKLQVVKSQNATLNKEVKTLKNQLIKAEQVKGQLQGQLLTLKQLMNKDAINHKARVAKETAEHRSTLRTQQETTRRQQRTQDKQYDREQSRQELAFLVDTARGHHGSMPHGGSSSSGGAFHRDGWVINPMAYKIQGNCNDEYNRQQQDAFYHDYMEFKQFQAMKQGQYAPP